MNGKTNKEQLKELMRSHVWCIPVDKGCVVLALLNIALVLGCVVAEIRHLTMFMREIERDPVHNMIDWNIVVAINTAFFAYITFEVLLIVGIKKRNPCYVGIYFVVGVLKVLGVLGLWIYFWVEFGFFAIITNIVAAVGLAYMTYLHMVFAAFINIHVEKLTQDKV